MTSINISIREEAYKFLKSLKSKDKSFSDVILELKKDRKFEKGSKEVVLEFAGVLKGRKIDWEDRKKRMKEFRDSFDNRTDETIKYMESYRK